MGFLTCTAKTAADNARAALVAAIGIGMPPTHAMTGAIVLVDSNRNVLFQATGNYQNQHVELYLMSQLYNFCVAQGAAGVPGFGQWQMPANSRVFLYVYDSPCTVCVRYLGISLNRCQTNDPTVRWKLGYTVLWLLPHQHGHLNANAALLAMNALGVMGEALPVIQQAREAPARSVVRPLAHVFDGQDAHALAWDNSRVAGAGLGTNGIMDAVGGKWVTGLTKTPAPATRRKSLRLASEQRGEASTNCSRPSRPSKGGK